MILHQLRKYPFLASIKDVAAICSPLAEHFKIDFFSYQRDYVDHQKSVQAQLAPLCNNVSFVEFVASYKYSEPTYYDFNNSSRYYFAHTVEPKLVSDISKNLKFNHILCKIERINNNEIDKFVFGTSSKDPEYINFYLNNHDLLDKFILYFREKAAKILNNAYQNPFKSNFPAKYFGNNPLNNIDAKRDIFLQEITSSKIALLNKQGQVTKIPEMEAKCLLLLNKGRSAKEIGNILNLSSRTVETNWSRSKIRLGCYTRKELLDLFDSHGYFNSFS